MLGHYVPLQLTAPPFAPGDEIAIHAAGGEVPAFDVLALRRPASSSIRAQPTSC